QSRGEANRIIVRRPRLDRDGLFLFGRRYDAHALTLTAAELDSLARGRWIAVDIANEYILYVRIEGMAGEEF
ncbi:hypothetical protein, partial [Cryobacterium roopkundense]|uniref:hypothetical protein n=1 Tax=Cryobacterium roopkundense TaxID=1001240 RepID=UPI0005697903